MDKTVNGFLHELAMYLMARFGGNCYNYKSVWYIHKDTEYSSSVVVQATDLRVYVFVFLGDGSILVNSECLNLKGEGYFELSDNIINSLLREDSISLYELVAKEDDRVHGFLSGVDMLSKDHKVVWLSKSFKGLIVKFYREGVDLEEIWVRK